MPRFKPLNSVQNLEAIGYKSKKTNFYGIEPRYLATGWPSLTGTQDAASFTALNVTGLAGAWRFYNERFSGAGRWFLWATIAFNLAGLNSLELQAHVPMLYALALWGVAIGAMLLARPQVDLKARHAERVCAGEILPVDIEVKHLRGLTGLSYLVVPHRLLAAIESVPEGGMSLPPLARHGVAKIRLGLRCTRRGVYRLQGFRVETDFPLGLLRAQRTFKQESRLLVYPQFTPLIQLHIATGRRFHPGGVALVSHLGDSFEFLGNRDYHEGDSIRDIDWRATARLNKAIVREYREEYFLRVAVVLDTHLPTSAGETERAAFERAVSLCAAVGDYMARQEYIVDILAAGPNLYHLTAGRSLAYLDQILDILACVDENPEEPFETLEPEILENLSQINTIICIFLDWNPTRRAFLERMQQSGAGIKAIIARDGPCTLDPAADSDLFGEIPIISRSIFALGIDEL